MSNDQSTEIAELKKQVAILMKVADKSRLAKEFPQEKMGTDIRVSFYQDDSMEPRLIKTWSLVKDFVRVTREKGVVEDQIVRLEFFDEDGKSSDKDTINKLQSLKMQIGKARVAGDEVKIKALTQKLQDIKEGMQTGLQLSLDDFNTYIEKDTVRVIATEQRDGVNYYSFEWKGEEYKLAEPFIN